MGPPRSQFSQKVFWRLEHRANTNKANILGSRQWEPSAALLAWVASSVELAIICMYEDIYLVQEKPMQN